MGRPKGPNKTAQERKLDNLLRLNRSLLDMQTCIEKCQNERMTLTIESVNSQTDLDFNLNVRKHLIQFFEQKRKEYIDLLRVELSE